MKKVLLLFAILMFVCVAQVAAQALHYDPYYVLPGSAGGIGIDAGLTTGDIGGIGDASDVYVMGKYSINDRLEAGARITLGFLNDGRDSFSDVTIGAKYGLSETSAATLNITPFNEIEEIGISAGYMMTMLMGGMDINNHLQLGLLDAYAAGIGIDLFIEPVKPINDKLIAYLDLLIGADTDEIGDTMNIDFAPNVDYNLAEGMVLNAGIGINLYNGIDRSSDIGLTVTAIKTMGSK